jgi:hypothetical protein
MYEFIRDKTREAGELMVRTESGKEHELHRHNTTFHDDTRMVEVDADDKIHWLNGDNVERAWIHKEF